jgi:murein L,D-transpeptidase YcbB/YkuD
MKFTFYSILFPGLLLGLACENPKPAQTARKAEPMAPTPGIKPETLLYDQQAATDSLASWVDSTSLDLKLFALQPMRIVPQLYAFYASRAFIPGWRIPTAQALLNFIRNLDQEGLSPAAYPIGELQSLLTQARQPNATPAQGARLDLMLSATYLTLADQLTRGVIQPEQLSGSWHIRPQSHDSLFTHLQQAVAGRVVPSLQALRPQFGQYTKLRRHLATYRKLQDEGGWPTVDKGPTLIPGDSSDRLPPIRQRLYLTGDLDTAPAQWAEPSRYDSSLIKAVNRYQQRNGLVVQPEINDLMVETMNVPVEVRLSQIMLNLDRTRWLTTGPMPPTYVLVNIPEYRLHVVEDGREIKLMRVIVGKTMTSTPVFSDMMEHVEFSPYWNVPNSIARNELWPKIRRSSSYLNRNHFEILNGWGSNASVVSRSNVNWGNLRSYRIRQKPGPWNALGQVKFMFPNQYAIYLHDTPADHLFEKNVRAFSHGCIRIGEPAWMADWLFPQFDREEIEEKMTNRRHEVVKLDTQIPVYIFYMTAFEDKAGHLNFRPDLYGLDTRLTKELAMTQ